MLAEGTMKNNFLVLAGAIAGGVAGHFIFIWLTRQGLYGLIIPGGLLGLCAGTFKTKSLPVSIVCGVMALAMGIFSEWRFAPFIADGSLGYFLSHAHQLKPATLLMILAGTAIGFWIPFRRTQDARRE